METRIKKKLHIAVISIDYPPVCNSTAVQMRDLAGEMLNQGHEPLVIVPTVDFNGSAWKVDIVDGVTVIRIAAPNTRCSSYSKRVIAEFFVPFLMLYRLWKNPIITKKIDLVVWCSPIIFFGPLVWFLKRSNKCPAYLILRDIFPEWAVDLGLLRKGVIYGFFKIIANIQYKIADIIGVQSPLNLIYFEKWVKHRSKRVEVLYNWQTWASPNKGSVINIDKTILAGRKILVYTGNMGIAQGVDILVDFAKEMMYRKDIGFLFVGRGSKVKWLRSMVSTYGLNNTLIFDEIDPSEIPGLLVQCFVGLVVLDPRHRSHNIPGKFLSYLLVGLPVIARINADTDLEHLINKEGVGYAYSGKSLRVLREFVEEIIAYPEKYVQMSNHCKTLARRLFSPEQAVKQIIKSLDQRLDC